jgi:outer membrane lipoprotein-sorting protein
MRTLLLLCLALRGTVHAESLKDLLPRLDQASAAFSGMTAQLKRISYTAVIKDTTEERGSIIMRLAKGRNLELKVDLSSPDEKSWSFRGRKAELFIPKINTVQEYDLGKHARLVDQFLLLGFGSSGRELEKNYVLKVSGQENVNGKPTTKLDLTPRSPEAQEHLKRVEIWIPLDSGYPVQQKFYLGSGDYVLVTYSEAKLTPNLPESAVRLNLPKNVKREYPQK